MDKSDARVGRLVISARSTGSPLAVHAIHGAEKSIRAALERLTDSEELVVLRRVQIRARGTVNQPWEIEHALEREVSRVLRARVASAVRFGDAVNLRSAEGVAFESEAVALAQYLLAIERGAGETWPFRAFAGWGKSSSQVLDHAVRRGRAFAGDVLAEFARSGAIDALLTIAAKAKPRHVEDLWLESSVAERSAISSLPASTFREFLRRLEQVLERFGELDGSELALERARALRLVVLAELFLKWPPLRDRALDVREIDELVRTALPGARWREAAARRTAAPSPSQAGGLVFWARLLTSLGVELEGAFTNPRLLEGVRWAIAHSLEDGAADRRDPLLLSWIGGELDAVVAPALGLAGEDPEPLFRVAMQTLLFGGTAPASVQLCRWGDLVVAFTGEIVLDVFAARSTHDAVPNLVKRLRARGLSEVPEIHVDSDAWGRVSDVLAELDTPLVPDAWRGAVLALTSLLRRAAREQHRTGVRELRKWPARLLEDRVIELRAHEVRAVDGGRWLGDGTVRLAGSRYHVRQVGQF